MSRKPRPERRATPSVRDARSAGAGRDEGTARAPGVSRAEAAGRSTREGRTERTDRAPRWAWTIIGAIGLIALLWACRGAPLGTAVADDYSFLYRLRFQHPLDFFDSMGATYYWRPLSRQVYFSLVGGWLLHAPWAAAALGATILLGVFFALDGAARRVFPAPIAAAIAVVPLLSEPARALLDWPSGAQHLLASLGAALAIHEAANGRIATAALAALGGVLSHESAALVLPVLPVIAWFRAPRPGEALRWGAAAIAVAMLWLIGYAIARSHGVVLPPRTKVPFPIFDLPLLLIRSIAAGLNLEDLPPIARDLLKGGYAILVGLGLLLLGRRRRLGGADSRMMIPAISGAWFAIGVLPLAFLLPDWNAWRAWVPSLGLSVGFASLLALAWPRLLVPFVALRLVALLLAPPAPTVVAKTAPETTSEMSFARLVRMQRATTSTRLVLAERHPTLPPGGRIVYWDLPRMTRIGFEDSLAARVWYRDSTLNWQGFGGELGVRRDIDAMVEFLDSRSSPAMIVDPEALRFYQAGMRMLLAGQRRTGDSLLALAAARTSLDGGPFAGSIFMNRAIAAFIDGRHAQADSFNRRAFELRGETADYWALEAKLALARGDRDAAIRAVRNCLTLDPGHEQARELAQQLGVEE